MSIRLRLTLLYTGLMATALILFSLLLYAVLHFAYQNAVDQTLVETAAEVAQTMRMPRLPWSTYVMIRDADQSVLGSSGVEGAFPIPDAALNGLPTFTTGNSTEGIPYRLYTLPITHRDSIIGWVQVAYDLRTLDTASLALRMPLIIGTILFVGLSAFAAWWMAQRAIAPVDHVARAAEDIGNAADLSLRVPYDGPPDEVGRLVGTFNAMLDQLQGVYGRLASAIDAQQRFVADASHELRTPLTIIRGNIGYLEKAGELDPEALADMASEAERMTRLVEELLTVARADAGQTPELQVVHLGPLVNDVCRKAQALPHAVEFSADLPEALNRVTVLGDAEWLGRALLILIENAFKYTPAGSVTVRAGRQSDGVVILVQDTGIGIAKEDLPHVFERFYRADRARTRGGAGLGLAIANWVAGVHGGKLTVDSELGKGSTFSLWLPIQRETINS